MDDPATGEAAPLATAEILQCEEQPLRFTGSGNEYFRIWAVNLALTVLTLGVYSAWAKVRRLQYFYRHTMLDDAAFDYVASPVAILRGRIIAVALSVLYYLAFDFSAIAGLVVTLALAIALPWLLWQSSRFKACNTRYRGLTFGFDGRLGEAYRTYLPPIAVLLSPSAIAAFVLGVKSQMWLGLLSLLGIVALPVFHALFRRFIQSNLRYGKARFGFAAKTSDFVRVWLKGMGVVVAVGLGVGSLTGLLLGLVGLLLGYNNIGLAGIGVWALGTSLGYILIGSYYTARFQKLLWEKTTIGDIGFRCDISARRLLRIQCENTLLVLLTLGLYRPFAAIRVARYRLGCMAVSGYWHLGDFCAGATQSRRGATGESAAEFFEMDVGL
ncbi:MAG: YjgN family protein [Sterolibacterium sp.]